MRPVVPSTRYSDFVAAARRHTPDTLLPALAAISADQFDGGAYLAKRGTIIYPWIVGAAARENIAFSNAYRSTAPVTNKDLGRLRNSYINLHDRFFDQLGQPDAFESFIVRTAFEQFPFQHSRYEDMSRVLLLFDRNYAGLGCKVLSPSAWETCLGLPLDAFMRTAFFIMVGARVNAGWFDPGWLQMAHFKPVLEALDVDSSQVLDVFSRYFGTTFAAFKRRVQQERNPDPLLHRYEFNPLVERPFVLMPNGRHIAPNIFYVAQRLSPAALYYVGWESFGKSFADDLGTVTEAYVGEQLDLLKPQQILHDVEYKAGQRAADYVVALPGLTLVVEVKSARVSPPGRLDVRAYLDDLNRDVGKALKQVKHTADMIRAGHPAFASIEPAQEIRGVVVTAEPHYMLNSPIYRQLIADPGYPTIILSLSEFEHAVGAAHVGDPASLFRNMITQNENGAFVAEAIAAHERTHGLSDVARNPLLDDAYERLWAPFEAKAAALKL